MHIRGQNSYNITNYNSKIDFPIFIQLPRLSVHPQRSTIKIVCVCSYVSSYISLVSSHPINTVLKGGANANQSKISYPKKET